MLQNGLIDECIFFYAPKVLGNGFAPFTIQGISTMDEAILFNIKKIAMSGEDLVVYAKPEGIKCSLA
jgi:diaminohydroxyphosphoribosylaminopyrimidine deaminase/5-amino-6-(5-phosphoribosylamino)uracil reductase